MTPFNRRELRSLGLAMSDVAADAEISYPRMTRAFYGTADHLTPDEVQRALRVIVRARHAREGAATA